MSNARNFPGYNASGTPRDEVGPNVAGAPYTPPPLPATAATTVTFEATSLTSLSITFDDADARFSFPNLTTILGAGGLFPLGFLGCSALEELNFPALQQILDLFAISGNPLLTELTFPALTTVSSGLAVSLNTALTSFSAPLFLPTDGSPIEFNGNALDAASVNHILARCVAAGVTTCTIKLEGGTNAAPTGQGITDAADLVTAGNTVTTN